jgi:hypothetical protein
MARRSEIEAPPKPRRPRGRPPIHLSLSLNLVMPEQFFAAGSEGSARGERRLMLAVLEDAVDALLKYATARDGRGRTLRDEAERWIEEDDTRSPFSFLNVCEALDLNPSCLRKGLARWKARACIRRAD